MHKYALQLAQRAYNLSEFNWVKHTDNTVRVQGGLAVSERMTLTFKVLL